MLLQWHITERCNLRCAHCYQTAYAGEEADYAGLLAILVQYRALLEARGKRRGQINVTGGEPFAHPDFPRLLDEFAAQREHFGFAILSNGTLIDAALARQLAAWQPEYVQVSLDGTEATHDRQRGAGNFARVVTAIEHLVAAGVRTAISFTASRENLGEFAQVARLGQQLKVHRVWSDRLIPCGQGESLRRSLLTPDETRAHFENMGTARAEARAAWFGKTTVSMRRALQFLVSDEPPYRCTAGDTLVTVMPNGDLYPCRRMPVRVGNLREQPLTQLYDCELFERLRDPEQIPAGCEECLYVRLCRGGLRCLSHAVTGDPLTADPGCWLARRQEMN